MINKIQSQIDNIGKSLRWIKKYRPADYNTKFLQLIENRRILRRVAIAAENNPGIAAFGKSQVGKSYLIGCLLQDNGKPFLVKADDQEYDFVLRINPPSDEGGGKESTGVVSRFSSFNRHPEAYNSHLPILVNSFTMKDIILVLSDSYFNDFVDYTLSSESDIKQMCEEWEGKYGAAQAASDTVLTADDILDIKAYFEYHINNAQTFIHSPFFDRLTLYIDKIPVADYVNVFSNLWNKEAQFTELFRRLMATIAKFNYAKKIYLPIGSVLHEGVKENTIMSVQCLRQLMESSSTFTTDAYVFENGQYVKKAPGIPKSEICAICSEVVFKIGEEFLSSARPYEWKTMDPEVQSRITHDNVKMEMLKTNDLLDFPGAKSREQESVKKLSASNVMDFFLRGKVAYLFNKYNEEMGINILLYCHHNKDNDVTYLYKLLEDWVHNYVGENPEERRKKLSITRKSPLFYIGTMFNLDLDMPVGGEATEMAIDQRWKGRFETVVNRQCFHRITTDWVNNWTGTNEYFKNSYVLRDYKFSTKIYDGFFQEGVETASKMTDDYYQKMRKTFIENQYVQDLFQDPEMSWDVAATMNNDGALYIIQNLSEVAARMDEARESDFINVLRKVAARTTNIMKDYYISTDLDEILEKNISKARSINREMDFTCNDDNYYFGHLLQALQLTEKESYQVIHKIMQSTEINAKVNDFKDYEIIKNSCANAGFPLESATTDEERWNCIIKAYGFGGQEEAEYYLTRKGVAFEKLFQGDFKRKLNSCVIADKVYDHWSEKIRSVEFLNEFTGEKGFDTAVMSVLTDNIVTTADNLKLRDIMAEDIAEFVNVIDIHKANESLLADMLASKINDFVLDFGYSYLSDETRGKAQKVCENRKLPAFKYILKETPEAYDEEELTDLFNQMSENPVAILPSFEESYNKWREFMVISFIANIDVPDFDHEANALLANILEKLKEVK